MKMHNIYQALRRPRRCLKQLTKKSIKLRCFSALEKDRLEMNPSGVSICLVRNQS